MGKVADLWPKHPVCAILLAQSSGPLRGSGLGAGGLRKAQGPTQDAGWGSDRKAPPKMQPQP